MIRWKRGFAFALYLFRLVQITCCPKFSHILTMSITKLSQHIHSISLVISVSYSILHEPSKTYLSYKAKFFSASAFNIILVKRLLVFFLYYRITCNKGLLPASWVVHTDCWGLTPSLKGTVCQFYKFTKMIKFCGIDILSL